MTVGLRKMCVAKQNRFDLIIAIVMSICNHGPMRANHSKLPGLLGFLGRISRGWSLSASKSVCHKHLENVCNSVTQIFSDQNMSVVHSCLLSFHPFRFFLPYHLAFIFIILFAANFDLIVAPCLWRCDGKCGEALWLKNCNDCLLEHMKRNGTLSQIANHDNNHCAI